MPKRPLVCLYAPNPKDDTKGVPYCSKHYGKPLGYMGAIAQHINLTRCTFYVTCPRCLRLIKETQR